MIIDKIGFYESKAGKCEVVAVRNGYAFGFDAFGSCSIWTCDGGEMCWRIGVEDHTITGPWPPRKPVEAWCVDHGTTFGQTRVWFDQQEEKARKFVANVDESWAPRLIRLIEAPE
jgi:hypothetical protein